MTRYVFAHYDPATGLIQQFSNTLFQVAGLAVAKAVRVPEGANGHTHKVDLARIVGCGGTKMCRLVAMPAEENPPPPYVTLEGLRETRNAALYRSDQFVNVPLKRPDRAAIVAQWEAYQAALRDLGRHDTIEAFVAAWPLRPDGGDDIADVRRNVLGVN